MKAANAFDLSSFSIGHVDAEAVVAEESSVPSTPEEQQVALFMVRPFDSPEKVPVEQSEKICSLLSSCRLNRGIVMEGEWEFKGATLLWLAARHNNVVGARMLLEAGADVNARCLPNNWTTRFEAPIHTATRFNNVEVLRLLLAGRKKFFFFFFFFFFFAPIFLFDSRFLLFFFFSSRCSCSKI
jgi:hypothetical protein